MTVEQATKLVKACAEQMNARYGKVVFDEWAIISLSENKGRLLAYIGPRKEGFQQNFLTDAGSLRAGLLTPEHGPGDFDFARQQVGTGFESYMVLGKGAYLICNNTVQSMDGITKDPLWLGAQVPFVELSDKVRSDPVTVTGGLSAHAIPCCRVVSSLPNSFLSRSGLKMPAHLIHCCRTFNEIPMASCARTTSPGRKFGATSGHFTFVRPMLA